jgi:predicted PurR-regulated permease PerM
LTKQRNWRHRLVIVTYRLVRWAHRRLPPVVRSLLGVLLMAGGIVGFLPILGFWMFPLGVALVISDFPPLRRRLEHWLNETRRRYHMDMLKNERRQRDAA